MSDSKTLEAIEGAGLSGEGVALGRSGDRTGGWSQQHLLRDCVWEGYREGWIWNLVQSGAGET